MELGKPLNIFAKDAAQNDALWYDEMQRHFVTLWLEKDEKDSKFQVLKIPSESMAEKLIPSPPVTIRLPSWQKKEQHCARPILAKFSLDQQFLAIQFTDTMVRIVPCSRPFDKHWTLDFAISTSPIATAVDQVPKNRSTNAHDTVGRILPGGVFWSDHGGNSQDLIIVTTLTVLCYKASLSRNSMSSTHSFSHPVASAVWWEPSCRIILVGSYSAPARELIMRSFFLQFPSALPKGMLPFRLELPPPDRLDPFPVSQFRPKSSNEGDIVPPAVSTDQVTLVNLYGNPYLVELGNMENGIGVAFYHLDRQHFSVNVTTYTCSDFSIPRPSITSLLVAVVDNVFCLHSTETNESLLLEVIPNKGIVYGSSIVNNEMQSTNLSFTPPSYMLSMNGNGILYTLSLNLSNIIEAAIDDTLSPVPFLLRRSHSEEAHKLVADELVRIMDDASDDIIGGMSDAQQTWKDAVVTAYASLPSMDKWDARASLPLMFQCGLLPQGAELQYRDGPATARPYNSVDRHSSPVRPLVLTQTEILQRILIPKAQHAMASSDKEKFAVVADTTLDLYCAFTARSCQPCLAMECFLIGLLWRLGNTREVLAMLRSKATFHSGSTLSHENSLERDPGVDTFAETVLAIVTKVKAGCGCDGALTLNPDALDVETSALVEQVLVSLASMASYRALAKWLLSRGRLMEAISVCSKHAHVYMERNEHAETIPVLSHVTEDELCGENFFLASLDYALIYCPEQGDRARLFCHLHEFLKVWDPRCLEIVPLRRNTSHTIGSVLIDSHHRAESFTGFVPRKRPSAVAALAMETYVARLFDKETIVSQSWLAHNVPFFPDMLFRDRQSEYGAMFGFQTSDYAI